MELTLDEQRLIDGFRKLTPSGRDELLATVASLLRAGGEGGVGDGTVSNQCGLKSRQSSPEAEKTPIFTE